MRITMNDVPALLLAGAAGIVLGAMFFGGLWWTIRQGMPSRRPGLWFAASLLLRVAMLLAGLYLVGGRDWRRLAMCLFGFALARLVVTTMTRPARPARSESASKVGHAP
jgi:F1F0 ATPase subunit 2